MADLSLAASLTPGQQQGIDADPVLHHLEHASLAYREVREAMDQREAELERARGALAAAEAESARLAAELAASHAEVARQAAAVQRQRERADELREILKEVHRSLFSGNVYDLILKACLSITGATRGLYLTWRAPGDTVRVRAAVDVDGYPQAPPSDYIRALCARVTGEHRTFICNESGGGDDLPAPASQAEHFRNCVVTPVVLLRNLDGIIIAADKAAGEFDEEDVATLLSVGDQGAVAVENRHLHRELQRAYVSTVTMLADAVEAKDPYTHGHCEMASRYARLVASRLELSDYEQAVVCYSALLHDVGKIGVSDGVLHKPGPLLPEERELMRAHVRVGHDLLASVPALGDIAKVVLHHHEWYDGTGYPDGLRAEQIPLAARVVAAVDAYCAMITRRSYKEAYTDEHARAELVRFSGTQFDPRVVEAFLAVLNLPEAHDQDEDWDGECGVLPGFAHIRELREAVA